MKIQKSKTTYVCEHCNKSYTVQKKAEDCESSCKAKAEAARKAKEEEQKQIDSFFHSESVSEIAEKISRYLTAKSKIKCRAEFQVRPNERCSNSHSAPKGKQSNWCGHDKTAPTSYMGLSGNLNIHIEGGYNSKVSNVCGCLGYKFGIHTGTGGCREHGLGWSVTIWADDFPKIKEKLENYFQALTEKSAYEREREDIEEDYAYAQRNYIADHPDYIEQENLVREAASKLSLIRENLTKEFITVSPKPQPKSKIVTQKDIEANLNSFL